MSILPLMLKLDGFVLTVEKCVGSNFYCHASYTNACVSLSIGALHFPKLAVSEFAQQIGRLYQDLVEEAFLGTEYEDDLGIYMFGDGKGHVQVRLEISDGRWYFRDSFETDQSFLLSLIQECKKLFADYPLKPIDSAFLKAVPKSLKEHS